MSINMINFWEILDLVLIFIEWLAYFIVVHTMSNKNKSTKFVYLCFTVILIISYTAHIKEVLPDFRVMIAILLSFLFYKINFEISISKSLIFAMIYWLLIMGFEAVSMGVIIYINNISEATLIVKNTVYRLEAIGLSKLLLLLEVLLCKYLNFSGKISRKDFIYIGIPVITNILSLFFIYGYILGYIDNKSISKPILLLLISVLYLISNIAIIMTVFKIIKNNKIIYEQKLINEKNAMEYRYYLKVEDNSDRIRRLYHDMKNHLLCISSLCDNDDAKDYVKNLNLELDSVADTFNTGNKILDIILSEKKTICNEHNIEFKIYSDFSNTGFIDMLDICVIFGNALDNAIDACKKVESGKRIITINTMIKKGLCIINIKNSKVNKIFHNKNKIITDKKDKFLHGIGLNNIKEAVNKYDGDMSTNFNDNEFIITIVIPYKSDY